PARGKALARSAQADGDRVRTRLVRAGGPGDQPGHRGKPGQTPGRAAGRRRGRRRGPLLCGALRETTARTAKTSRHKLATRLSPGEKRGRKRMAEVGAVCDAAPVPRAPADIISAPGHAGGQERSRKKGPV